MLARWLPPSQHPVSRFEEQGRVLIHVSTHVEHEAVRPADKCVGIADARPDNAGLAEQLERRALQKVLEPLKESEADDAVRHECPHHLSVRGRFESSFRSQCAMPHEQEPGIGARYHAVGKVREVHKVLRAKLDPVDLPQAGWWDAQSLCLQDP